MVAFLHTTSVNDYGIMVSLITDRIKLVVPVAAVSQYLDIFNFIEIICSARQSHISLV